MVYNLRDKDKESTESSAVEEEVPNDPPNQEETGSEEGDIPANMDADLEEYLKNRGVCSSTMDALKARSHSALRLNHGRNPSKSGLPWYIRCCSRWCRV